MQGQGVPAVSTTFSGSEEQDTLAGEPVMVAGQLRNIPGADALAGRLPVISITNNNNLTRGSEGSDGSCPYDEYLSWYGWRCYRYDEHWYGWCCHPYNEHDTAAHVLHVGASGATSVARSERNSPDGRAICRRLFNTASRARRVGPGGAAAIARSEWSSTDGAAICCRHTGRA